jgi:hypothetical protein
MYVYFLLVNIIHVPEPCNCCTRKLAMLSKKGTAYALCTLFPAVKPKVVTTGPCV